MRYDERQRYFGKIWKRMLRILVANRLKRKYLIAFNVEMKQRKWFAYTNFVGIFRFLELRKR